MTTAFGDWSMTDLRALLAAKDFDFGRLGAHYAAASPGWSSSDPTAYVGWTNDWVALQARYQAARTSAERALMLADFVLTPDKDLSAEGAYVGVLTALKAKADRYGAGATSTGDFDDLDRRLQIATGQPTDYSGEPQPDPGSDRDLQIIQWIDNHVPAALQARKWPPWLLPAAAAGGAVWLASSVRNLLR